MRGRNTRKRRRVELADEDEGEDEEDEDEREGRTNAGRARSPIRDEVESSSARMRARSVDTFARILRARSPRVVMTTWGTPQLAKGAGRLEQMDQAKMGKRIPGHKVNRTESRLTCTLTLSDVVVSDPREIPIEAEDPPIEVKREDLRYALEFIELLKNATLEGSGLTEEQVHRLRSPPQTEFTIRDPVVRLSVALFLALENASQECYNAVRDAIIAYSADIPVLTLFKVGTSYESL